MAKSFKCLELPNLDITLMQHGFDRFSVTYGKQFHTDLDYGQAATELGACIMHAISVERLDNRTREEAKIAGDKAPYVDGGGPLVLIKTA
jgi:hypothetical protein